VNGRPHDGRVVQLWERRKARAFPPGAIRFHLGGWARGRLRGPEASEAAALLRSWNLDALYVLHGNALERPGHEAVVVLGPPGIGKSRVCESLVADGWASSVEDGLVLVGSRGDRWYVVETGTLRVLSRASWIRRRVYRLSGGRASSDLAAHRRRASWGWHLSRLRGRAAFALAVLLTRDERPFAPRLIPVSRLVVARHPLVERPDLRVDASQVAVPIVDVASWVPASVALREVSSLGTAAEVLERLRIAIVRADTASDERERAS